jgi:hypothetical protein
MDVWYKKGEIYRTLEMDEDKWDDGKLIIFRI